MKNTQYIRKVQTSVTNFLYCGDCYLFVKRHKNKKVDPGRLNGIGGRLEEGENFLEAAIRETKEETGYQVNLADIDLTGIVKLEGGYTEDWIMCFFKIKISDMNIPFGRNTDEGEFIWLHKDKVLDSSYELVDDLNYCFKDIVEGDKILFLNAKLGEDQKIFDMNLSSLKKTPKHR